MPYRASYYYESLAYITPTDVKDYHYCKAIPWLRARTGLHEPPTPSMEAGVVDYSYKERVASQLGLPKPYRLEVRVVDKGLGVSGVIDVVAGSGRLRVVEVKAGVRRVGRHHTAQLKVYALLAQRNLGPVEEAILYTSRAVQRLRVTPRLLEEAARSVEATRRAVGSEDPPVVSQPAAKCRYCWYNRLCPLRSF